MAPYDTPGTPFDTHLGPRPTPTPKIVAHGGGHEERMLVLKGNPVGYVVSPSGGLMPYLSARTEHQHLPTEKAMIQHARLGNVDLDHYHLGQIMPAVHPSPTRNIAPSSQYQWPDTSISGAITAHPVFGAPGHPGPRFPRGAMYNEQQGSVRKPER